MFKNLNLDALGVSGRDSEIIELILSNGFKSVDLDLLDFAAQVESVGLPRARRLIDSARLKIGSFRLPLNFETEASAFKQELEQVVKYAELAKELGCTRAETIIPPTSDQRPFHENYELLRKRFTEAADVLAKYNIRLGVGFVAPLSYRAGHAYQFVQTVDALFLLLKSISAKNVGLSLDAWHWHLGGGTLDQLRSLGAERIIAVALADADAGTTAENADENTRRLPGETGVVDSPALLQTLAALKYDGPVTPKPAKAVFQGQGRDKIMKQTGAALDAVWKAAGLGVRPGLAGRT